MPPIIVEIGSTATRQGLRTHYDPRELTPDELVQLAHEKGVDPEGNPSQVAARLSAHVEFTDLEGPRVTTISLPEGTPLGEAIVTLTNANGVLFHHLQPDTSDSPAQYVQPDWVRSTSPSLEAALIELFGLDPEADAPTPEAIEQRYHTESGPPGIGPNPDDPRAPRLIGAKVGTDVEAIEAQAIAGTEVASLRDIGEVDSDGNDVHHVRLPRGFRQGHVRALFPQLRVDAGRDFQSRVMGDTASTGTGSYAAANYIALTEDATAPAAGDTTLTGELVVGTSAGLQRAQATYAHTAGTLTYTLTKTFTLTGATPRTIQKIGVFNASSAGTLVFETAVPSPPTLVTNDSVAITETVNIT